MNKHKITYLIFFFSVCAYFLFINSENEGSESLLYKALHNKDAISAIKIPEKVYFAGERVPTENFDTRESLERELITNTYWHSQTLLLIKRSTRYFPIIDSILKIHEVPSDFKYMAVAESGLAHVISPSNAVGFWQFLEGTAKDYGLIVNDMVDERYHIEKSTEAACKYILESFEKFGSWTMAAASYNRGRKFITEQMNIQKQNNYYDLLLGEEGERYVFRIIALKMIIESPQDYGFVNNNEDYPPIPYYIVNIDTTINGLGIFANDLNTNYKLLKILNPWLRKPYLTVYKNESYQIKIPSKGFRAAKSLPDNPDIVKQEPDTSYINAE